MGGLLTGSPLIFARPAVPVRAPSGVTSTIQQHLRTRQPSQIQPKPLSSRLVPLASSTSNTSLAGLPALIGSFDDSGVPPPVAVTRTETTTTTTATGGAAQPTQEQVDTKVGLLAQLP